MMQNRFGRGPWNLVGLVFGARAAGFDVAVLAPALAGSVRVS